MSKVKFSRALVVAGLAVSMLMAPASFAGSGTGTVKAGHAGAFLFGATETEFIAKSCAGIPATQGTDAWVIETGVVTNQRFEVVGSSLAPFSLNVTFYSPACLATGVNQTGVKNNFSQTSWRGALPINTKWAVVSVPYGANVNLNWSTCTPSQFVSCPY